MRMLALCLCVMPSLGQALSCLPWGVTDAYLQADRSDASYIPVIGTLDFDENALPLARLKNPDDLPKDTTIPATFDGLAMVRRGADAPFATDLTLRVECAAHWCGGATPGKVLAFLRKDGDAYTLGSGPCGGYVFSAPDRATIKKVRQCLKGRACAPSALR